MKNENTTQHTEGKWIVTGQDKNHVSVVTGHFIADCSLFKRFGLMLLLEEQQANARLIASAPDLLKENEQLKITNEALEDNLLDKDIEVDTVKFNLQKMTKSYSEAMQKGAEIESLNNELLGSNEYLEGVRASQAKELTRLQALNAELLSALKQCVEDYSEFREIEMSGNKEHMDDWWEDRSNVDPKIDRRFQSAIAKAEGKTLGVS